MRRKLLVPAALLAVSVLVPLGITSSVSSAPDSLRAERTLSYDDADPGKPVGTAPAGTKEAPGAFETEGIAGGYVFVPINPYRTFDSRDYADGYMLGGDTTWFDVLTDSHGTPQIPSNAVAVTYNLAIVDTSGSGFLAIYPADINWPGNASINWTGPGTTLSNGGTVAIGYYTAPGQVEIYCGPALWTTGTDFVVDITGYYI
jgi:hypothetical protein